MTTQIIVLSLLAILGLAAVLTVLLLGVGTQEMASGELNAGWETGQHSPLIEGNLSDVFSEVDGVQPPDFPEI